MFELLFVRKNNFLLKRETTSRVWENETSSTAKSRWRQKYSIVGKRPKTSLL